MGTLLQAFTSFLQNLSLVSIILGAAGLVCLCISLLNKVLAAFGKPNLPLPYMPSLFGSGMMLIFTAAIFFAVAVSLPLDNDSPPPETWSCFDHLKAITPLNEEQFQLGEEIIFSWEHNEQFRTAPADLVWTIFLDPPAGTPQSIQIPGGNPVSFSLAEFEVDNWSGIYSWYLEGSTDSGQWCNCEYINYQFERLGETPTITNTPPGTITPSPTMTPSPSMTPSPTMDCSTDVIVSAINGNQNCRSGPGNIYPVVGYLMKGEISVAHATGEDGFDWLYIENPDEPPSFCYVYTLSGILSVLEGNTNCLPTRMNPPTPQVITSTVEAENPSGPPRIICQPALDKTNCNLAGGTWVKPLAGGKPYCKCD